FARFDSIDTQSPRLDCALLADLGKRAEGTGACRLKHGKPCVTVEILRNVVDPDEVEAFGTEALETVLDRFHCALFRIVVHDLVGASVLEQIALFAEVAIPGFDLVEDNPPNFRTQHVLVSFVPGHKLAHADFRQAGAVQRCGIKVTNALIPCGGNRPQRFLFRNVPEHVSQWCSAVAKRAVQQGVSNLHGVLQRVGYLCVLDPDGLCVYKGMCNRRVKARVRSRSRRIYSCESCGVHICSLAVAKISALHVSANARAWLPFNWARGRIVGGRAAVPTAGGSM